MYLPGAHPRLKRDRRRRDGWRREGGRNAAVNVSSPINIVPRAFCPPVPRVFRHILPSLPTPSLFIAETHTVSYCASNFCMRHSRVSVVPRTIIMPPNKRWWNEPFIAVRAARMLLPFSGPTLASSVSLPHSSARYRSVLVPLPHDPISRRYTTHRARGSPLGRGPHLRHELSLRIISGSVSNRGGRTWSIH